MKDVSVIVAILSELTAQELQFSWDRL